MKTIFKLLKLVKSFLLIIILAVINGIIGNLSAILISVFASFALIKALGYEVAMSYELIISLMIVFGIIRGALRYFEQYSNHFIAFKILARIRHIIFEKIRELSPTFLDRHESGDVISQITSDVETLEVFYAHTISPVMIALFVNGGLVIFISIYINIYTGLIFLFSYLLVGVILPLIYYNLSKKTGRKYRKELASFNSYFLDTIQGSKDLNLTNNQEVASEECLKNTSSLQKLNVKNVEKQTIVRGIVDFTIVFMAIILILFGLLMTKYGLDSRLIIVAVITLLSSFGPITALANLPSNLNQTFASANRLFTLLNEKPLVNEIKNKNDFEFDTLTLKNISFKYEEKNILNNINLEVKKGDFIGILGPSGAGKSTILKLILGFYNYEGEIYFNDLNKNEINTSSLYDNVKMFSQSTYLFNDTIRNNMLIAKKDATDEEIIEALKKASIDEFVLSLDNKLDEVINENSTNISLGQKQRLGLARVFLVKPKLLLLDEATSNIDAINEGIILSSLKKEKENMTVIMISHKLSTLKIADTLYELNNGELHAIS